MDKTTSAIYLFLKSRGFAGPKTIFVAFVVGLFALGAVDAVRAKISSMWTALGDRVIAQAKRPVEPKSIDPGSPKSQSDPKQSQELRCLRRKEADAKQATLEVAEARRALDKCRTEFRTQWFSNETPETHCLSHRANLARSEAVAAVVMEARCSKAPAK